MTESSRTDTRVDVLEVDPPRFSPEEASRAAAGVFGLEGTVTPFCSERDQNFLIDDGRGRRGVFKISNPGEDPAILDMETLAALQVAKVDPALPVALPWLVPGCDPKDGAAAYRASVPAPDGSGTHHVRIFNHLPGRGSIDPLELDRDALWDLGAIIARLGLALRGFFHPAAGRVILWDVQYALALRPMTASIEDPTRRAIVEEVLDRFEKHVTPVWPLLRSQAIHGDITLDNVLVDERARVTGIVDFGDMSHSALVCDISSTLASVLSGRVAEEFFSSAAALIDGYQTLTPLEEIELRVLGELLAARGAAGACISAVRVARYRDNEYIAGFEDESWSILDQLAEAGFGEASARISGDRNWSGSIQELRQRRRRVLGSAISPLSYRSPLHLIRGEGVWMWDAEGARYLDVYNNVPVVGHCHPRVTEAVARQARTLNTNMRYLHGAVIELAERLVASMPEGSGLDTVMVVNSGSEANEIAWRLAKAWTGKDGGIVTEFAYHGVTSATADLSPEEWTSARRPPHVETIPAPDSYRDRLEQPTGWAARAAKAVVAATERLAARDRDLAMTLIDGGLTSDGILTPPHVFLREVERLTHQAGGLYVADEVQVGHGRTGEHLWSFAGAGLRPDVVTLGKPMGNGHPVAAVITRAEIAARLGEEAEFFSTFGGNPVAAAAALAVLDVIRDQDLVRRAAEVGAELRSALAALAERHPAIGEVRGRGLLVGVDLVEDRGSREPASELAAQVQNALRDRGVLVGTTGPRGNVLKLRPPLVFSREHVRIVADALDWVLP